MLLRQYRRSDCPVLGQLFYDTVHTVNRRDYSEEQLNAWATGTICLEAWNRSFLEQYTVVAEQDGVLVGFGSVAADGYIAMLYVHKDHQRRGIGTALCAALEKARGSGKCTVQASVTAVTFFQKRGYTVVREQQVVRCGLVLTNFLMERCLPAC